MIKGEAGSVRMELSRREVPLYGQAKVFALLQALEPEPEDCEVFIVLEGSMLAHVIRAHWDVMLCFIVPGHNLAEEVSVHAYMCSETTPLTYVGGANLEYVLDDAQDLAEHLVTHSQCLTSADHRELSSLFCLGQESSRWAMDRRLALAMANLDIPPLWSLLPGPCGHDYSPRESALHLAVRWGLCSLAELLLCQPGGLLAVSLPNEEGVSPLQLALSAGHAEMLELLTHPPNPLATPPAGLTQVWVDRTRLLRYAHDSKNLTLTVRQNREWGWNPPWNRHNDVLILRERLRNQTFIRELQSLRRSERVLEKELVEQPVENGLSPAYTPGGVCSTEEKVYEEPLMFCLNEEAEEEEEEPSLSEKGQSVQGPQAGQNSSTQAAASRLAAMIQGPDQVYANAMLVDQVDDLDIKYRAPGEGEEVISGPQRSSPRWDAFTGSPPDPGAYHQESPAAQPQGWKRGTLSPRMLHHGGEQPSHFRHSTPLPLTSPPPSSSSLACPFLLSERDPGGVGRRTKPCPSLLCGLSQRDGSLPEEPCTQRFTLDAADGDSGEEDILGHSYPLTSPRQRPALQSSFREERDSFITSPDFTHTHSHSTPTKDPGEAELRLRSYSYCSPKAQQTRPLFARDSAISDLAEDGVCSSRGPSLLQALSLSKPLSLIHSAKQRSTSLCETSREKRIEDEEWDKYIVPSKVESEKYKVSRTFSFLKSRMSSTRSKAKVKGKEVKDTKEKTGGTNGHQFVPGSPSGVSVCVACDRPVPVRDLVECSYCSLIVHKACRDTAAACGKRPLEKTAAAAMMKNKSCVVPQNSVVREGSSTPSSPSSPTSSLPIMVPRDRRDMAAALSKSPSVCTDRRKSDVVGANSMEGGGGSSWPSEPPSEEGNPIPTDPPSIPQELVDAPLLSDLSAELQGLEAESWSRVVSPEFCRKYDKHTVKRQDVIYELMQTELHHIQTLSVMAEVFRRGMLEQLQLDPDVVSRMFPCLDPLLGLHRGLFSSLQERRSASTQPGGRDYVILNIGDVLLLHFSEESAERMQQVYGEFCSHHTEAVHVFKELQQQNKKLQAFIKQQGNNSVVRRREVPEFILLVTQRITKYPVLLERILQYTLEGSQEHEDLSRALAQVRGIITAVDQSVSEFEKGQELQEVLSRMENKSLAKLKNGKVFRKQDLTSHQRALQHKGVVYWKTATGRLKETLSLLLTDVLVFLQEKDQRFIFAAVDQKPPVIPLQKLIVREVANEERGMFLISASSAGPEMYEVHTVSRDERNAWMRHIRKAVESCPEEEEDEERSVESDEARRVAEARVQKIHRFQETLQEQDQRICTDLEEKLQLYAELAELTLHTPEPLPQRHLLVNPDTDTETPPQASTLLTAALQEAEKLISSLQPQVYDPAPPGLKLHNCYSNDSYLESPCESDYLSTLSVSSTSLVSDCEWAWPDGVLWHRVEGLRGESCGLQLKVADSVQSLTQLLYSLQAAVTLQDSCYEVQKLLLLEPERPLPRPTPSLYGNTEPDSQRSLEGGRKEVERRSSERRKEEVEGVQKLQARLRQEQQRWDRECQAREKQQGELESVLEQRERQCHLEAERLRCERQELDSQLEEYQQSLERLREGQRSVARERERLEGQQRLLHGWRHNRQSSLPVMIPLPGYQDTSHSRSGSLDGNGSVFVNEAALLQSLQQNHLQNHQNHLQNHALQKSQRKHQDSPIPSPSHTSSLGLSPSLYNSLNTLLSQAHSKQAPEARTLHHPQIQGLQQPASSSANPFRPGFTMAHQGINNHFSPPLDQLSLSSLRSGVTGVSLYKEGYPPSSPLTPQDYLTLEGQNGEDREEKIVYL